jgi:hypothetical protein
MGWDIKEVSLSLSHSFPFSLSRPQTKFTKNYPTFVKLRKKTSETFHIDLSAKKISL